MGGTKDPLYVINISAKQNMVTIGTKEDLYSSSLTAKKVSWCSILPPKKTIEATAKIRRQHKPEKAFIIPQEGSGKNAEFNISVAPYAGIWRTSLFIFISEIF
ncbi:hypothetical protein AGMMS50239_41490 [Bacteroidia bacterium]|nr:hypothetical protein AGMMS50239_41490 [Bacteroidia bacterium]